MGKPLKKKITVKVNPETSPVQLYRINGIGKPIKGKYFVVKSLGKAFSAVNTDKTRAYVRDLKELFKTPEAAIAAIKNKTYVWYITGYHELSEIYHGYQTLTGEGKVFNSKGEAVYYVIKTFKTKKEALEHRIKILNAKIDKQCKDLVKSQKLMIKAKAQRDSHKEPAPVKKVAPKKALPSLEAAQ